MTSPVGRPHMLHRVGWAGPALALLVAAPIVLHDLRVAKRASTLGELGRATLVLLRATELFNAMVERLLGHRSLSVICITSPTLHPRS